MHTLNMLLFCWVLQIVIHHPSPGRMGRRRVPFLSMVLRAWRCPVARVGVVQCILGEEVGIILGVRAICVQLQLSKWPPGIVDRCEQMEKERKKTQNTLEWIRQLWMGLLGVNAVPEQENQLDKWTARSACKGLPITDLLVFVKRLHVFYSVPGHTSCRAS